MTGKSKKRSYKKRSRRSKFRGGYIFEPSEEEKELSRQALYQIYLENGSDFDKFKDDFKEEAILRHAAAAFGPEAGRKQALANLSKLVEYSKNGIYNAGAAVYNKFKGATDANTTRGIKTFCDVPKAVGSAMNRYGLITGKGFTRSQQIIYDNVKKTVEPLCRNEALLLQTEFSTNPAAGVGPLRSLEETRADVQKPGKSNLLQAFRQQVFPEDETGIEFTTMRSQRPKTPMPKSPDPVATNRAGRLDLLQGGKKRMRSRRRY